MRTLRLFLMGMVIMALLGGLGGVVVAQEKDLSSAEWLTATEEGVFTEGDCTMYTGGADRRPGPDGLGYEVRGVRFTCEVTFSDPRLSGKQTTDINEDCFAEGGCVNWGTMEIVGPDGTWRGWFAGNEDPNTNTNLYIVLSGEGEYEGLVNIRHATGPFYGPMAQVGVIYRGDPPPMPPSPE